jgi:hypothetical protein
MLSDTRLRLPDAWLLVSSQFYDSARHSGATDVGIPYRVPTIAVRPKAHRVTHPGSCSPSPFGGCGQVHFGSLEYYARIPEDLGLSLHCNLPEHDTRDPASYIKAGRGRRAEDLDERLRLILIRLHLAPDPICAASPLLHLVTPSSIQIDKQE